MADLLIATKAFCNTLKAGSFTGDTTMCPTRSQIESAGLYIKKGYTYATDQLVPQDHIERLDWEYTFSVTPTTATISAAGGSQKFTVTSYKRQYSYSNAGNRIYVEGSQTNVGYTSSNSGSGTWTAANDTISYGANTGSTQPSGTITWTQSESFGSDPKKTATATHKQNADSIKPSGDGYSNPRITAFSYPTVIPAAGGNSTPSYSYEQTVYWVSGKTTTLTSGGTPTFNRTSGTATVNSSSGLANTGSKGTTQSGQTTVAVVSLTITMNGKSSSASSANVSQAENSYSDSWGSWSVSCSANLTTISASGGTSTLSGTASRTGTRTWSSGSTQSLNSGNQTVTNFSIVSSVTGFSISGSTVTASSNSSTSSRSVRVRGTYGGVNSNEVTITQSGATSTNYFEYSISLSPTTASFSASGESKNFSVTSQRRLVTVNSVSGTTYGSWGSTGWEIYPTNLGTGFSQTTSGNTITVKASANSGSSRSGTLSVRCTGDTSETASANLSQSGATSTNYFEYSISLSPTTASFSASGESKNFSVTSQRRLVTVNSVSGTTYGSWGSTGWEIYPTNLGTGFSQTTSGNTITVKASANSGSSRSGTLSVRCTGDTSETASANLSQSGATTTTTTEYEFSVSPTSLSFTKDGGNQTVSIVSRSRPKYTNDINGEVSYGNWSAVSYSASSTNSAFSSTTPTGTSTNSASVSVGVNTGAARSATITYTQSGSGTKKTVSCSQDMGIQDRTVRRYVFSVSPTSVNIGSSGESIVLDVTSYYETATQTNSGSGWVTGSWGGKTGVTPGTRLGSSSSPFSVSSPSAGSTGNYTISVSAGANSSTSSRTGSLSLSQARSGIQENGSSWSSPANINVPLKQDGKVEIIVADINFTVRNNTSRYINGLQIGYNYKGSSYTIFTAATIGVSDERSGHVTVPPRTPITWFAIGNNTSLNISPSSGNYNGGVVTTINFSIY